MDNALQHQPDRQPPMPAHPSRPTALLPNEPRLLNAARQEALTQRHLQPAQASLLALFTALRRACDPALQRAQPSKLGKPYPLGQCWEIVHAVEQQLPRLNAAALAHGPLAAGYHALQTFLANGGELRHVWGDLRGCYFQNAFLLGNWYVDVANDTVDPTKPAVELLPFSDAKLRPIASYAHFATLAERYWNLTLYPNHLLPALAPYVPLLAVSPAGVQLHALCDYMLALTCRAAFEPSIVALQAPPMPAELFAALRTRLPQPSPATPGDGRQQALSACRRARAKGHHQNVAHRNAAVQQALMAIQRLNGTDV